MTVSKFMFQLTHLALLILSLSMMTSVSLSVGYHLLLLPPLIYFVKRFNLKKLPASAWFLLALSLVMLISILVNQDSISHPIKNILKLRYYFFGVFAILPLNYYLNEYLSTSEKMKVVTRGLLVLMVSSAVADLLGLVGFFTGFHPWVDRETYSRNGGVLGRVMTYGHAVAWLSVLWLGLWVEARNRLAILSSRILTSLLGLSFLGLYSTHTRGAWIAFITGCLVLKRRFAVIFLVLFLVVGGSAWYLDPHFFQQRLIRENSNGERMGSWMGAWKAFQEKPFLGHGFLNFGPHSIAIKKRYDLPHAEFEGHAHQEFLEILATTGIFGGVLFLFWMGFWIFEMRQRKDAVGRIVLALISAFLVSGLTQVTLTDGQNAFFVMAFYTLSHVL